MADFSKMLMPLTVGEFPLGEWTAEDEESDHTILTTNITAQLWLLSEEQRAAEPGPTPELVFLTLHYGGGGGKECTCHRIAMSSAPAILKLAEDIKLALAEAGVDQYGNKVQ